MLTDVDLPAPGLLWTRWATLSATCAAIGQAGPWTIDGRGADFAEGERNWARFALLDGRRAVVYGHHEHSATTRADPPVDLLTGAPDWLPWDALSPLAEGDRLGFVIWHENGRWSRVRYPGRLADGMTGMLAPLLSTEHTLAALGRLGARPAAEELIAAATRGAVTGDHIAALITGPDADIASAVTVAARGGLVPGSAAPRIEPGRRPPMRRVRRLSKGEHDRLVWAAMQDSPELTRPAPPASEELDTLISWLRERSPHGDGRCTLLAYADSTSFSSQPGGFPPGDRPGEERYAAFRRLTELVRALRHTESDPRYGRWLFLRVETSATGVQVERRYDSWPPWWHDDGVSGPWRTNLQEEMTSRGPVWRPSWVTLLDPEIAYRPTS
ncbi:hypothetical protein KZ829_20535 [Actinoplanes hulinensis]|uniref:Uncharacterized protein n=1 Tax=Actinoplanes hulinensis TaxID=1144547 RepID=A0ABS7B5S0_9ACTN|nr:hypothetical protein [Actinoplanes hulinensis]MBW6436129.1 hypothetical protein [Actinoplanes hulinensis]